MSAAAVASSPAAASPPSAMSSPLPFMGFGEFLVRIGSLAILSVVYDIFVLFLVPCSKGRWRRPRLEVLMVGNLDLGVLAAFRKPQLN